MTTLFRLDASILPSTSSSRALADLVETEWLTAHPSSDVVRRDLAVEPIPATAWADTVTSNFVPEEDRTDRQRAARALATEIADELVHADALLFAVPLYNYGVSQHFKTWYDIVGTDPRFGPGAAPLADRPAFLVTARGGGYGPGTPREGWDHATGWMRRVLSDVWGLDLDVIETELTLAEVTPQMAELRDLARAQLAESHDAARAGGRSVTLKLRAAA